MTDHPPQLAHLEYLGDATRFAGPGRPLKRVRESSPIVASLASSAVSAEPWLARATAFEGSFQRSAPRSTSSDPTCIAVFITPDMGLISAASAESSSARALRFGGLNGIAGGPSRPASVIDSITRTRAIPSA